MARFVFQNENNDFGLLQLPHPTRVDLRAQGCIPKPLAQNKIMFVHLFFWIYILPFLTMDLTEAVNKAYKQLHFSLKIS